MGALTTVYMRLSMLKGKKTKRRKKYKRGKRKKNNLHGGRTYGGSSSMCFLYEKLRIIVHLSNTLNHPGISTNEIDPRVQVSKNMTHGIQECNCQLN